MKILTKRPEGMDFKEYKEHMKLQSKMIARRTQHGILQHVSWENIYNDQPPYQVLEVRKFPPYVNPDNPHNIRTRRNRTVAYAHVYPNGVFEQVRMNNGRK